VLSFFFSSWNLFFPLFFFVLFFFFSVIFFFVHLLHLLLLLLLLFISLLFSFPSALFHDSNEVLINRPIFLFSSSFSCGIEEFVRKTKSEF